ncbi:MAG: fused MFS/spermidine synthase [Amphritea sp.]
MTGIEVYRCYDEYGPLRVFDDGSYRYLTFGEGGEQSRIDMNNRAQPVYEYIQAMLMALLFSPTPRHATLLGLGAGSLANALLHYSSTLEIEAIELRPQVVAVAQNWFQLDNSQRLTLHINDAKLYLEQSPASTDLIFTDIFNDHGMQEDQLDQIFLDNCYQCLSADGILVLNLWDEGKGFHPLARERLSELFGRQWIFCPVDSGNLIVYAFKGGVSDISHRRLQPAAKRLGKALNAPFNRLINKLQQV